MSERDIYGIKRSKRAEARTRAKDAPKLWYSVKEAIEMLGIEERLFWGKLRALNFEARELAGERGEYISLRQLQALLYLIKGPSQNE